MILDLAGTGITITELSRSQKFVDSSGDGLLHRSAWAGVGNAVLFFDDNNSGSIDEKKEYIFTEWDAAAGGDLEALRSVFDSNGDGKLTSADAKWSQFKVEKVNADGSTTVETLAQAGITEINLKPDATNIVLPDGSVIIGQTTFKKSDGSTGTVANTLIVSEADGNRVVQTVTTNGAGNRVVETRSYGLDGSLTFQMVSETTPSGSSITNTYDDNGDGAFDRVQTIATATVAGVKTETLTNYAGSDTTSGVVANLTRTITSADGKTITIERELDGGGWVEQREVRVTNADGSRSITLQDLARNGTVIRSVTETYNASGLSRSELTDADGNGASDSKLEQTIVNNADQTRTTTLTVKNGNDTLRSSETLTVSATGRTQTLTQDLDGDGDTDRQQVSVLTVNGDGSSSSAVTVKNGDASTRTVTTIASGRRRYALKNSRGISDMAGRRRLTEVERRETIPSCHAAIA